MKVKFNTAVAFLGLAAVMALPSSILAQAPDPGTPPATGAASQQNATARRQGMRRLLNGLNLSAAQKSRIRSIMQAHHKQVKALKANASLTADKQQDQLKELRKDARKQIMEVLTADQKTRLKELRKDEKAKQAEETTAK